MKSKYILVYRFGGDIQKIEVTEPMYYVNGFWVTEDLEDARHCHSRSRFYIPGQKVDYIEKLYPDKKTRIREILDD